MSKNLTRKGLAIGAVVALGTTLFAGAPAYAASVLFAPTTGTGNTLVAGETFSLTASLSSDLPASNSTQLKFKVANTNGVAATVKVNSKTILAAATYSTNTAGTFYKPVALDASVGGATAGSTLAAGTTSAVYGVTSEVVDLSAATTTPVVVTGGASTATNPTTVSITSTAATTASYAVTAFLDANNNGLVDSGEFSSVQTVNFVKIADSGVVANFTTPNQSTNALSATISFNADVNVQQLTVANYKLGFGRYTTSGEVNTLGTQVTPASQGAVSGSTAVAVVFDSTAKNLKLAATNNAHYWTGSADATGVVAGTTYGAQVYYSATGSSHAAVGSETLAVASTTQANSATALAPVISDNAVLVSGTTFNVRTGTTTTALVQTIKKNTSSTDSTQIAVGAGVSVTYSIASAPTLGTDSSSVADTISVNGVALTSSTTYPVTGTVLTDANGKISIPVVTRAGVATTSVTVSTVPTNSAVAATPATLTWADATLLAPVDLAVGNAVHSVVKGGTYTASYALRDSYNALYTGSAYRVRFTEPGAAGSTAPTSNTVYVPFVNGIAAVSVADNSTGAGSNAATITIEKNTNGLWASVANSAPDAALYTYNTTSASNVPFKVTLTAPVATAVTVPAAVTGASIDTAATFGAADQRTAYNSATVPSGFTPAKQTGSAAPYVIVADSRNVISGQVTDANGVGIAGASVTIAAAGVQFVSGSVTGGTWAQGGSASAVDTYTPFTLTAPSVYAVGSITVTADATGSYSVAAYSHVAGKIVYTVTSGAATASTSITYTGVSGYTTATKIAVSGPTTSQAARAATFTATVTDKLGNVVSGMALKATVSGVGSFAGSTSSDGSVALTTGTDGTVSIKVLFASNDLGDAVVTFADASGQTTPLPAVASTISVGATDAQVDIVGKRVTAVASFSKGKTVAFYVDGVKKWSKLSASDADVVLNYNLKKGTHTVTMKISGGFVVTERFIVK